MAFAENTSVSVAKTKAELETLIVRKHRACGYQSGFLNGQSRVEFVLKDRLVRFTLDMPVAANFRKTSGGAVRSPSQIEAAVDQEMRRLWRCLLLAVKAKLECVMSGISTFEDEFLAQIVDPATGLTVGETVKPILALNYAGNKKPLLLTGPTNGSASGSTSRSRLSCDVTSNLRHSGMWGRCCGTSPNGIRVGKTLVNTSNEPRISS